MKNAEHTPNRKNQDAPHEDSGTSTSDELEDVELEAVAGGVTWHLPKDPATTPWEDSGED